MRRVLEKHEYEYLQAYNIFVKRKEQELKEFIQEMDSKSDDKKNLDARIRKLENEKFKLIQKNNKSESEVLSLKKQLMEQAIKMKDEVEEKDFYH
jgi:DNA repair exonuclease SbcCD ATPase subunit